MDKGLRIVGKTTDGKDVYAGLYRMTETNGIPLSFVVDYVLSRNGMPDWIRLLDEMTTHGMKRSNAVAMIRDSMPLDWPVTALIEKLEMQAVG